MAQSVLDSTRSRSSQSGKEVPVVPLVPPKRRRPTWVVAGALLIGTAAIVGAWIFSSSTSRLPIVVAARDLEPGDVLQASDLRVVEITTAPDMRAIQESQQSLVIGRVARGPIPAGTVVNTDLSAYPETVRTIRLSVREYLRATRSCKLYDFEAGRWLPYSAARA